jgi:nucleosome binding factor SPN SPT16 subunit
LREAGRTGQERSALGGPRTNEGRISAAPLTGDEYRNWTDSLRDIEELVTDQDMKAEVARVREAAREMRVEYKRHSKEPQWSLVQKMIAEPLSRLREQVNEELLQKAAERNSLVPIDRDPVPSSFQRQLDRYYENLGSGSRR